MKPNPKEINIILNILKGAQFEFLLRAPFYIDTPLDLRRVKEPEENRNITIFIMYTSRQILLY
jgi:hypothetical protein